jgi:hypothetical protein
MSTDDILKKLKEAFDVILPQGSDHPPEAMKLGTLVRSTRHDRLGVITDSFYGDVDLMGTKIIVYTVLLLPPTPGLAMPSAKKDQFYLTNEYEYELVGYLMMEPIDIKKLSQYMGGGLVL